MLLLLLKPHRQLLDHVFGCRASAVTDREWLAIADTRTVVGGAEQARAAMGPEDAIVKLAHRATGQ